MWCIRLPHGIHALWRKCECLIRKQQQQQQQQQQKNENCRNINFKTAGRQKSLGPKGQW